MKVTVNIKTKPQVGSQASGEIEGLARYLLSRNKKAHHSYRKRIKVLEDAAERLKAAPDFYTIPNSTVASILLDWVEDMEHILWMLEKEAASINTDLEISSVFKDLLMPSDE